MRIKICGITNLKDALDAIDAGADALGFVFYTKSARYIEPSEAKKIISVLPPFIQTVGLFVEESATNVDNIMNIARLDIAQIHFAASEEFYKDLKSKYFKVIRAQSKDDIVNNQDKYVLVDAFVPEFGGEGKRLELDWFKDVDCSKIILAGGLTSQNLKELKDFNFYGVDVSSGVEAQKGKKDRQKMISFCKVANELS